MNVSVGTKLICTYLSVVALMAAPAVGIYYYLRHVRQSQTQVLTVAQPTVAAAKGVREGLHQSAAGLRGFIALGGEHFRNQREQGRQIAQQNLETLDRLTQAAPVGERQLLDQLRRELGDIQAIHQAMEAAPRQTSEIPAFQKLAGDSTPLGERMLAASSAMIEAESKLEKTPQREKLLEEMTALRAALHGSLVEMHSYLTTAQEQHVKNFGDQWQALGAEIAALAAKRRMLTAEQDRQFAQVQQLVNQFRPLPDRLFAMRKSESWNVAQRQVQDEAAPREARAEAVFAQVIGQSEDRSQQAQQTLQAQSAWLGTFAVGGPGAAAVLGIAIGWAATRRVSRRLQQTMKAMEAVAAGELTARLPAETRDEFGRMALAINLMAEAAVDQAPAAAPQSEPQIIPELNTERLRSFVDAEIGRRRPHVRPQAAPARQQEAFAAASQDQAADSTTADSMQADTNRRQTMQSFQAALGQIMTTAGHLAAGTRQVAASMPASTSGTAGARPATEPTEVAPFVELPAAPALTGATDAQLRQAVSRQTESLAQSSERLRAQAAQLDQLMRQLQQGLVQMPDAATQAVEEADMALANIHGAENPLAGPNVPVGVGQSLLQTV